MRFIIIFIVKISSITIQIRIEYFIKIIYDLIITINIELILVFKINFMF